jgi:hypothetical protein
MTDKKRPVVSELKRRELPSAAHKHCAKKYLVIAPLLGRRDGRPLGSRGLSCDGLSHAVVVNQPHRAPKGFVEVQAGLLGARSLGGIEGPTHADALIASFLADEYADDDSLLLGADSRLPAHAIAELDALAIIRGDVALKSRERNLVLLSKQADALADFFGPQ